MEFSVIKSPYPVRIQENAEQKNSVFGHFSRSVFFTESFIIDVWQYPKYASKIGWRLCCNLYISILSQYEGNILSR